MAWVVAAAASSGGEECEMEVEGMMQLLWSTGGDVDRQKLSENFGESNVRQRASRRYKSPFVHVTWNGLMNFFKLWLKTVKPRRTHLW